MNQLTSAAAAGRDELRLLMRAIASGNAEALKQLYNRTSAKLYGICLRLLRDDSEAEDVLQEVYIIVWNKAALFDPSRASPITWLATLARNRSIDRLRRRGAHVADDIEAAIAFPDDEPSSLEVIERAEDSLRLQHCIDSLKAAASSAIRAAFFEGATYPELAERAGIPLATMKSRIRRGLQNLRECLEQ